jgi:hypothetical protein
MASAEMCLDDTAVTVLCARPELLADSTFLSSARATELTGKLLCQSDLGLEDADATQLGPHILKALSALTTKNSSDERRGAAEGLLEVIVEWESLVELIYEDPSCLTLAVVRAYRDAPQRIRTLMAALYEGDVEAAKIKTLLADPNSEIKNLVTLGLPWDTTQTGLNLVVSVRSS